MQNPARGRLQYGLEKNYGTRSDQDAIPFSDRGALVSWVGKYANVVLGKAGKRDPTHSEAQLKMHT